MRHLRLRKLFKNPLAFSLVELVLVVALMALLASAIVPSIKKSMVTTTEKELTSYFTLVEYQAGSIVTTYNQAMTDGITPVLAGYSLTSARGMQECLRSANNHSDVYDVEVCTVYEEPDTSLYNFIDTIVVCVQFYRYNPSDIYHPILLVNKKGLACSPEQAVNGSPDFCDVLAVWYIKKGTEQIYKYGSAMYQ